MRRLPINKTNRHKLIIKAVDDYFGLGCPPKNKWLKTNICLWLMNRKKRVKLNEEQKEALWFIKGNLADTTYRQSLISTP